MPKLRYVGWTDSAPKNYACFNYAVYDCPLLEEIDIRSLETVDCSGQAFNYAFKGNTSLPVMKFQSLKTAYGSNYFNNMFNGCTSLANVYFYALDTDSFGTYTNQFSSMLTGVTGCTVHFPKRIQSTIGSWSSVTGGMGGTNTVVLFDINTSITGANSVVYARQEKDSTATATAWVSNDVLYYTSGTTEPSVGDTVYSDDSCTTAVTTISSIA